jgi:hypothetical protein
MRCNPSALLKLLTGKVVLTAGIVTLGVGGVTAAAITDVSLSGAPTFEAEATTSDTGSSTESTTESATESSTESSTESADGSNHGQTVSEFARTTDLEGCEKGQAIADLASSKSGEDAETSDADHDPCDHEDVSSEDSSTDDSATDDSVTDDGSSDVENHGQTVSDFAHTTELEGCEKGQAISDLASSKADEHRQNPEREHDPCDHADEGSADALEASLEADEADEAAPGQSGSAHGQSGQRGNGNGNGNANGHDKQGGQGD